MPETRGYTSSDVASLRSPRAAATEELSGSNTVDIIKFGDPAAKISFQTSGTLTCNVEVSLNGTNWVSAGSGSSTIVSYSTHNVMAVRATHTAGTGRLHVATS